MMNVIPVINCPDAACAAGKIAVLRKFLPPGALVHIDVTDGEFSDHPTWNDPSGWADLHSPFPPEVHLMVARPEEWADDWFTMGARRLVVHAETADFASVHRLLDLAARHHGEIMLSSVPASDPELLGRYARRFGERLGAYQVLTVPPGAAGQRFGGDEAIERVAFLRRSAPHATIEVDGGMDPETARLVKIAGADTIVSASYIFGSDDPGKAYERLENI